MRKGWLVGCLLALVGIGSALAAPVPLLWKAEGKAGTVYMLGSFHLLTPEDYPLHPQVELAYSEAGRVVFEVDPAEMTAPETMASIQALAKFDDGRTLRSVIPEETAAKLQAFMGGSEAAMASSDAFKPWFMGMNLAVGAMTAAGLNPSLGLDQHFMQRAAADGKPVSGLETVLEQLGALDNSPLEEQAQMLDEALGPPAEMRKKLMELLDIWRSGDDTRLVDMINGEMIDKTPQMYVLLNRDRNLKWLPQVSAMLDSGEGTHLVIVGAMHLIGEDGLVQMLRAQGIDVQRVDPDTVQIQLLDEAA